MFIQHFIGCSQLMFFRKPFNGVVVNHNFGDAVGRDATDQNGCDHNGNTVAGRKAANLNQKAPHQGMVFFALTAGMPIPFQLVIGNHHDVSGNKQDRQQPSQKNTNGNKEPKYLYRGNRCQRERGKAGHSGQRCVQHRLEQRVHHVFNRFALIANGWIAIKKLRQDMHRIKHRNGHNKNRNH